MKVILRKVRPYLLMILLQLGSAGMYTISKVTLNHGMNRYVLIVYRNAIAALTMAPFALILERKTRPKMALPIFLHILALGFVEVVLDQGFGYLGMKLTSASFTSAIMNAVPSITFLIAVLFGMERLKMREVRSQAKVMGTIVTFAGALLMSLYKGPLIHLFWSKETHRGHDQVHGPGDVSNKHRLLGTLLILVACVAWSCFYVLQSMTLRKYPAELSLTCLICFSGALQSLGIALAVEHRPSGWAVGCDSRLFAPLYTGIVSSGITYYVQGIVMKTKGPVFVTAFNPLCMIIVAALGSAILQEQLHLGSVLGGIIIAIGLYSVVWGKSKEDGVMVSEASTLGKATTHSQLPVSCAINAPKINATSTKVGSHTPAN